MQSNTHSQAIPEAIISSAETAITTQLQAISPYATPLTAEDRRNLLKMGAKRFQFVTLAHTLAEQNPHLTSKAFDMAAFTIDYHDAQSLFGLLSKARQLTEILEDIVMTAGSDARHYALEFYADVKLEASRNIPEAKTIYEQLKAAYPSKSRKYRSEADEGGQD